MSDPRFSDPPPDPMLRRDTSVGDTWGWIAGLAVLALISFVLIAGWNNNSTTANNGTAPITGSSAPSTPASTPSTTGSGTTSPMSPMVPSPPPANSDQK